MLILQESNYRDKFDATYLLNAGFQLFGKINNEYVALQTANNMVNYQIKEVIVELPKRTKDNRVMIERKKKKIQILMGKDIFKHKYKIMVAYTARG